MKKKPKVKKEKVEKKELSVRFILIYEFYESVFSFMSIDEPKVRTFDTLTELQKWLKKQKTFKISGNL